MAAYIYLRAALAYMYPKLRLRRGEEAAVLKIKLLNSVINAFYNFFHGYVVLRSNIII